MSTNPTTPSGPMPSQMPPMVPSPDAIIQPSLNSIMIGHTFLTLLLPLLVALFYYSTPSSRRQPIFILNVVVIILAFAAGVMIDALAIHSILTPMNPWPPSINIAIGILGAFQSIFVDLILLVRLISVHPLSHTGLFKFVLLTALPILLKLARVINMIVFIKVLADAARGPMGAENIAVVWATTPYLKIEWSAQMVDNAYMSLIFLWTIRARRGSRQGVTSNISPNRVTFAQRMRMLSRIALSNFLIPTLFSIAQLIVVYRNVNVLVVNEIVLVNTMLAVFGVVFASVWAGSVRREPEKWRDSTGEFGKREKERGSGKDGSGFAFPGLGSWKVATQPPGMTIGTTELTDSSRAGSGKQGDLMDEVHMHSLQVKVDDETATGSSALPSPAVY